jgi:outer membrane lipoprotein SlyB
MGISNKRFWNYWKRGMYEEALRCEVEEKNNIEQNRLQTMLFGTPEQLKQTGAITVASASEFIYDLIMINPTVVKGLDFARTEDLSTLFTLSQFASQIDPTVLTGDMAQLQGYVAEQMIAAELQAKGHDVEFPIDSNNPEWDILVDGQPFQVKSLVNPDGVREHLEKYPDIPVYVNEELAPYFEGNPNVYISNICREEVIEATSTTLKHADDLLDFEIPWIAAGVSTIYNIKRVWKDDVTINQAVLNIMSDTSSRIILGTLGQKAGTIAGALLFGPAGAITGAMFGVFVGASQGGRLSSRIKLALSKKQEKEMNKAMDDLIKKVIFQIDQKFEIKKRKFAKLRQEMEDTKANKVIWREFERRYKNEVTYLSNRREELQNINEAIKKGLTNVIDILPNVMAIITKCGVHSYYLQREIKNLQLKTNQYLKKV